MTTCKGCFKDLLLAIVFFSVSAAIVWAQETQDLTIFGTVSHVRDGVVKTNPICSLVMIGVMVIMLLLVMVKLSLAQRGIVRASDVATWGGYADPLPGVTRSARAGAGTVLIVMGMLALPVIFAAAWLLGGS